MRFIKQVFGHKPRRREVKLKIAMLYPNNPPFGPESHDQQGLGGSENGFVNTFKQLVAYGHRVEVFNQNPLSVDNGVYSWQNIQYFDRKKRYDVVYSLRHSEVFDQEMNAGLRVLFLADTESGHLGERILADRLDLVMAVSNWQKEKIAREEKIHDDHWFTTSNGIVSDKRAFYPHSAKVKGRCLFIGTPERGLPTLLELWPRILMGAPHASLQLFSSHIAWGDSAERNLENWGEQYKQAADLGIINSIHGNAADIRKAQEQAEFYLYPSDFRETCCMSILESMYLGAIPIATARAALLEKVIPGVTGFTVPDYGAASSRYQQLFANVAMDALNTPSRDFERLRENGRTYASQYTYDVLVPLWVNEWERRLREKGWAVTP